MHYYCIFLHSVGAIASSPSPPTTTVGVIPSVGVISSHILPVTCNGSGCIVTSKVCKNSNMSHRHINS